MMHSQTATSSSQHAGRFATSNRSYVAPLAILMNYSEGNRAETPKDGAHATYSRRLSLESRQRQM